MRHPLRASATLALSSGLLVACASPLNPSTTPSSTSPGQRHMLLPSAPDPAQGRSVFREDQDPPPSSAEFQLDQGATPDDYVRYALYHSPELESAYQRWRGAAERVPQARALPDPRLSVGFFANEIETRTGPQQAKLGLTQTLPWPGGLSARTDAAAAQARSAWYDYKGVELRVTRVVVTAIVELAYLDDAIGITRENLDLLASFEGIIRARYRVGTGTHPELIRTQVELGQLDDRLAQLLAMRPVYIARLNAALNRPGQTPIPPLGPLPARLADADAPALIAAARVSSPVLLALDEQVQGQRRLTDAARYASRPELTVGIDYSITDEAKNPSMSESGDDPVMITFGINLPIWREKYDASVRESIARRLALGHDRQNRANTLDAAINEAYFDHTDADRRVRLYERTLIPKSRQSLQAALGGFRAGDASFTDLLDTERTMLEFALSARRARADRAIALARLGELVGTDIPTVLTDTQTNDQTNSPPKNQPKNKTDETTEAQP